jgi:hypothetical protein
VDRAAFTRSGPLCLTSEFRQNVDLALQDIRQSMPNGLFDLILCRNLLFTCFVDEALRRRILRQLHSSSAAPSAPSSIARADRDRLRDIAGRPCCHAAFAEVGEDRDGILLGVSRDAPRRFWPLRPEVRLLHIRSMARPQTRILPAMR